MALADSQLEEISRQSVHPGFDMYDCLVKQLEQSRHSLQRFDWLDQRVWQPENTVDITEDDRIILDSGRESIQARQQEAREALEAAEQLRKDIGLIGQSTILPAKKRDLLAIDSEESETEGNSVNCLGLAAALLLLAGIDCFGLAGLAMTLGRWRWGWPSHP